MGLRWRRTADGETLWSPIGRDAVRARVPMMEPGRAAFQLPSSLRTCSPERQSFLYATASSVPWEEAFPSGEPSRPAVPCGGDKRKCLRHQPWKPDRDPCFRPVRSGRKRNPPSRPSRPMAGPGRFDCGTPTFAPANARPAVPQVCGWRPLVCASRCKLS